MHIICDNIYILAFGLYSSFINYTRQTLVRYRLLNHKNLVFRNFIQSKREKKSCRNGCHDAKNGVLDVSQSRSFFKFSYNVKIYLFIQHFLSLIFSIFSFSRHFPKVFGTKMVVIHQNVGGLDLSFFARTNNFAFLLLPCPCPYQF